MRLDEYLAHRYTFTVPLSHCENSVGEQLEVDINLQTIKIN
jgi:hypothetical protein